MENLNKITDFSVKHFIGDENAKYLKKSKGLKSPGVSYKTNIPVMILCAVILSFGCRKDSIRESVNSTPAKKYPVHFSAGFSGTETEFKAQKRITQALSARALKNQIYYLSYYVTRPEQPNVVLKRIDQRYTDVSYTLKITAIIYRINLLGIN